MIGNPSNSKSYTIASDQLAICLDKNCLIDKDYSLTLVGKVREFDFLANFRVIYYDESFQDAILCYKGDFWVSLEFLYV